ncbi:ATP-grasp domain-containing protein [Achromobacter aloeverae]
MLLLEVDGKRLFRAAGIATPEGVLLAEAAPAASLPGAGPWIAKAQVPVGGRGKAGGVLPVAGLQALPETLGKLLGLEIKGCVTREVLVEEVAAGDEHYLSIMVDAGAGGIRLMHTAHGGMNVESHAPAGDGFDELLPLDRQAVASAISRLIQRQPAELRDGLQATASRLADLFFERQLMLAEINPLFALPDGRFVAGDAKVVIDMNALPAQPELRELIEQGRERYPDAWRKLAEDFDFVEIDRQGQVGLVTTGAGLSMMLIDEMVGRGLKPFNFCDMRTGQMRGSPARLLRIFDWLEAAPDVRVVLVNIFAGITDLSEFTQLLIDALHERPAFRRPIVARLVGNGEAAARRIVAAHPDLHIRFEPDLERAIALTAELLANPLPSRANHAA